MESRKMFSDILVIVPKQNTLRDSNLHYSDKSTILKTTSRKMSANIF